LLVRLGAAGLAVLVLWALADRLPVGAARRLAALRAEHEAALATSLDELDFTRVRYHASQLEILAPEAGRRHRALVAKAELMRDLLMRPTWLASPEGLGQATRRVLTIEGLLGPAPDPDVLVLKAFVLWRVAEHRDGEREAADLCAQALRIAPGGFALGPLARHYVRAYLHQPHPHDRDPAREEGALRYLRGLVPGEDADPAFPPFQHVIAFDRLVRRLDRASTAAYLALLDAQADYQRARARLGAAREPALADARSATLGEAQREVLAAKERRLARAQDVEAAWAAFDEALERDPLVAGSPSVLAVFTLNDAVLVRARWFVAQPDAPGPAPALVADAPAAAPRAAPGRTAADPAAARLARAPLRIAWAHRYATLLGPHTRRVLELQEARRYQEDEADVLAFERAYLVWAATRATTPAPTAPLLALARAAARLGLYVDRPDGGRRPYATVLLEDARTITPADRASVDVEGARRRLRLL
jgi:hypothetical protein